MPTGQAAARSPSAARRLVFWISHWVGETDREQGTDPRGQHTARGLGNWQVPFRVGPVPCQPLPSQGLYLSFPLMQAAWELKWGFTEGLLRMDRNKQGQEAGVF